MSVHGAASPAAWDRGRGVLSGGPLTRLAAGTRAMALAELRKLRHDHIDVIAADRAYLAPGVSDADGSARHAVTTRVHVRWTTCSLTRCWS
jgi:hypothetical protein